MRHRFPFLAAGSAAVVCAIAAQAHPVSLKSACEEHHHFFPSHQIVLKPDVLQQPYHEFLATHGSTPCSVDNNKNIAPASCGGVDRAAFARHTAQQICEKESTIAGVPLKYNLEMILTTATASQPPPTSPGYFPYTLRIACGVCSGSDVPPT